MTIEALEARKNELLAQQNQFVANTHAISGAIQDCDYWISQLKQAEAATAKAAIAQTAFEQQAAQ